MNNRDIPRGSNPAHRELEGRAGSFAPSWPGQTPDHKAYVMKRKTHFAGLAVLRALYPVLLGTLLGAPFATAAPATVSGVVRNRAGEPQIGAQVELLRADLSVAATVSTDAKGRFRMASVLPGRYSFKAICSSYLPTLRENVRVRSGTVVNLTLNTLYEALQWLPTQPRKQSAQKDDWMWTLRSAENRPLLRWLEDGPLVVVDGGRGGTPKLRARLMATGQEGTFGESGERYSFSVEETPADSRELLARVDFAPGSDAGMESMLGFRQDLGYTGSVQSVAAVSVQPSVEGPYGQGLEEWVMKTWETARLGPALEIEAGSTAVVAHMPGARHAARTLPFANLSWQGGNTTVSYRMSSFVPAQRAEDETAAAGWMPAVTMQNGGLAVARGLHQEIGWERRTDASGLSVALFSDHIKNPVLEAATRFAAGGQDSLDAEALVDGSGNLLRATGPGFSTSGISASVERRLPAGNRVRLSYANGDALVIPAATGSVSLGALLARARPRRAQTYTLALSGTLEGTGTRWRASYRWQPEDTVTAVAPYQLDAASPYMNLHLRQPLRLRREGSSSFEFLLDVRNLLADGYRPYLLNDGSLLLFAQEQRGMRAGLAFTF